MMSPRISRGAMGKCGFVPNVWRRAFAAQLTVLELRLCAWLARELLDAVNRKLGGRPPRVEHVEASSPARKLEVVHELDHRSPRLDVWQVELIGAPVEKALQLAD
eukprot:532683-Prymnesium_polylepis.1